jgi:hypothetical protein
VPDDILNDPQVIATVDQLGAIIRDTLDKLDAPITDRRVQLALTFFARLLLDMDPDPSERVLWAHAALQRSLEAVR